MSQQTRASLIIATASGALAILACLGGWVWLASGDRSTAMAALRQHEAKLGDIEQRVRRVESNAERLARVEEKIDAMRDSIRRIEHSFRSNP